MPTSACLPFVCTKLKPPDVDFFEEAAMARSPSLASMSVDALLKLRDDIGVVLSRRADALKKELASLGADYREVGRIAIYGKNRRKGRKVAPKYRDRKTGATWAGRGAQPVWLRERLKAGAKLDDFLIKRQSKVAASGRKRAAKKSRRKRK
jgi:DNA-binding protein H-NS